MGTHRDDIDELTRLAIIHGTDKWGPHFYTPVYHSLFSKRRNDFIRLLEIGVGGYTSPVLGGASLAMWADYFPNGHIVGIDISEKKLSLDSRISIHQGSQTDPAFLKDIVAEHGPFDIIIDDGSHIPQHVVQTFHILWPTLADGGSYVIEDTQTSMWESWGGSLRDGGDTFKLARTMMDGLNFAEAAVASPNLVIDNQIKTIRSVHAFHNLIVVEKGDNDEPSNFAYDPRNRFAAYAIETIQAEMRCTPTAAGYANLISVYRMGKDFDSAVKTSEQALARWPDHPALVAAASKAYAAAGDTTKAEALQNKLKIFQPPESALS